MLRGQEDGGGGLPQTSQTAQSPTNTQVEHTSLRLTLNGSQVSITRQGKTYNTQTSQLMDLKKTLLMVMAFFIDKGENMI